MKRLHGDLTFTFEDQKYWNYLDLTDARPVPNPTRYDHILVDEFQDINPLDLALIDQIAKNNVATLTIVGDDDQAIFEWRGASPRFILEPGNYVKRKFATHILRVNYRSPRNIVHHSQKLISHNKTRVRKDVESASSSADAKIEIVRTRDIAEDLDLVTKIVQETQPGRVAVIAKLRAQLIPYEIYFASEDVEFETAADLDLFQDDTLSRISNILLVQDKQEGNSLVHNSVDNAVAICDLICKFPLNKKERDQLSRFLTERAPRTVKSAVSAIADYPNDIMKKSPQDVYSSAVKFLEADHLADALRCLADFDGLTHNPLKAEDEIFFTDPPLRQLATLVENKGWTAEELVGMIYKARGQIKEFNMRNGDEPNAGMNHRPLHLMTAHRSKGKEFETVVILSVLENVWPHKRATTAAQIEAERRLFYVAFTRAKKHVIMLSGPEQVQRSRFVDELDLPSSSS